MCMMCDGFSAEDVVALEGARIAEYGFTMVGVTAREPGDVGYEWTYTLGLLDAVGHPELVLAGPETESAARLLGAIARDVLAGERFAPGDQLGVPPHAVRFGAVDPIQYALGTFASWYQNREAGHLSAPQLEAVQVFAPDDWFCACHQGRQPDLSDPKVRLYATGTGPMANRAERRARARRARRRTHPR